MKCSHVFSDTGDTLLTCNRPANLDDGRPACDEHATPRGWVYVMAWGEYVKIGFSQDPLVRLAQLGSDRAGAIMPPDQPGTVTLLGAVPGSIATEQLIHAALDDARTVGEWFRRTSHVDRVVSLHRDQGNLPGPTSHLGSGAGSRDEDDGLLMRTLLALGLRAWDKGER